MHKCIIRIITNSPFQSHTTAIFKELNLLKINDVFKLKIAEKMQKNKNNTQLYSTQPISDIKKTHKYNTQHSFNQNYFLPQKRTELGKKFHLLDLTFGKKYHLTQRVYHYLNLRQN